MTAPTQRRGCWSCGGGSGETLLFCRVCGAIQPPDFRQNFFDVLSMTASFVVERRELEERYRQAQQQCHPDRFVTRAATERRLSAEHVTRLNEAYQTLRDPLNRAVYLVDLAGGNTAAAVDDPAFLMEVMESRESLSEIDPRSRDAAARIDRMRRRVNDNESAEIAALTIHLADFPTLTPEKLEECARLISRLRFHRRFLEELEQVEERLASG